MSLKILAIFLKIMRQSSMFMGLNVPKIKHEFMSKMPCQIILSSAEPCMKPSSLSLVRSLLPSLARKLVLNPARSHQLSPARSHNLSLVGNVLPGQARIPLLNPVRSHQLNLVIKHYVRPRQKPSLSLFRNQLSCLFRNLLPFAKPSMKPSSKPSQYPSL